MTLDKIKDLQKKYEIDDLQNMIDSGIAWHLEGQIGRTAMAHLKVGSCYLPEERHKDYWGNIVPSRKDVKPGTAGSLENSKKYWKKHEEENKDECD